MEIRKSGSTVFNGVQNNSNTETENKAVKSFARGIASAKDSFEVSSSSNQENSGTKQLGVNEQQEASKMNYKDFGKTDDSSQNNRPTYEDAKNSGLAARLGHSEKKDEASSKKQLPNGVTVADLKNSPAQSEQTSAAVKDAQQKLNGGRTNYRDALDQEVARRQQDVVMHGGTSALDRAYSAPDPTATPRGKGNVPTGREARESGYDDLPLIKFFTGGDKKPKSKNDGEGLHSTDENKKLQKENPGLDNFVKTTYVNGGTDTPRSRMLNAGEDAKLNEWDSPDGNTHYRELKDGTIVGKSKDGTITVTKGDDKTVTHPDGSFEDYHDGKKTDSGGAVKMPGSEDRESANIPDDIKKSIEYDMQQIRNAKPKSGGETELTDGGVTGNSAEGSGPINNAFTRTGGVMGAVAQPTRAGEYVGGPSNGTVGSAVQNGGATDSLDGSSWTGTTHQDDPADVQFGSQTPVAEGSVKSKNTDDSASDSTVLDGILNRKSKKAQ